MGKWVEGKHDIRVSETVMKKNQQKEKSEIYVKGRQGKGVRGGKGD